MKWEIFGVFLILPCSFQAESLPSVSSVSLLELPSPSASNGSHKVCENLNLDHMFKEEPKD